MRSKPKQRAVDAIESAGDGRSGASRDTRAKMIQAAIEVFGSHGYDGASTRLLAERAEVNLAAIPYHFGGKRELYLAAASAIADYARGRIDPVIVRLRDATRGDAAARIDEALTSFFRIVVGGEEPEVWTSFVVRCEHEADEAFEMIYQEVNARFQSALTDAVVEATGARRDDALQMRVAIVLASIFNFRTFRNMTLKTLGWEALNPPRFAQLEVAVRQFALGELLARPAGRAGKALKHSKPKSTRRRK